MAFSYIVIFTCVWWVVFYTALPFGVKVIKPQKRGHDLGAPQNPHLGIKVIASTVITAILTAIIVYVIQHGYLTKFIDSYVDWLSTTL